MVRPDGRKPDEMRSIRITPGFIKTAAGSALIEFGNTRVICTAMMDEKVPPFLKDSGRGWLTAEYAMLPASTPERKVRDGIRQDGRSTEIQRLIGRSLRSIMDFSALGERTIYIDCDVLEADGGTRTAAISGAFIALVFAVDKLIGRKLISCSPLRSYVAAASVGLIGGRACLDLCYEEDSGAEADMNVVMTDAFEMIEVQGTGEKRPFTRAEMEKLLKLADKGILEVIGTQKTVLGDLGTLVGGSRE
ncbi:MAG: ribonuclease PH [Bacillota bacterium]|nr:ribonuclease PH [Bacillota bacterium]